MEMEFITRGESSYQGKPKIYISYYGDNITEVVHHIVPLFLKHKNCTICYLKINGNKVDLNEKTDILKQMAVVVFPVSYTQLTLLSEAKEDMDLCKENHVPMIPILLDCTESAEFYLEYERVFGDIQLLMPHITDTSKVSYHELLENYLASIISDDVDSYCAYQREGYFPKNIMEMIPSAFRARVFLSYRKCDRRSVRELIAMLHKEPMLDDVMIWFDEYLIPGENYNVDLAEQISACDIFLILGTEAALAKNNYILTSDIIN